MSDPNLVARLEPGIEQCRGVPRLKPTCARRFYQDGGRLVVAADAGGACQPDSGLWTPERLIASIGTATNLSVPWRRQPVAARDSITG